MGAWYRVIKTIKGHRYVYEQRTRREGTHVRTENRYVGPADGGTSRTGAPGKGDGSGKGRGKETVTTTGPVTGPPLPVDDAFTALLKPITDPPSWRLPWSKSRIGWNRVKSVDEVDDILEKFDFFFEEDPQGAFYNPEDNIINIPPMRLFSNTDMETATQAYYATFLHELAHWTGHESRLSRHSFEDFFVTYSYAREELVAEATATILMHHFKIAPSNLTNHANYFQTWLARAGEREEALAYARREAERAARFILELPLHDT